MLGAGLLALLGAACAGERSSEGGPFRATVAAPSPDPPSRPLEEMEAAPSPSSSAPHAPPSRAPAPKDERPELFPKARVAWVRERPDAGADWLGYLRAGASVRMKTGEPRFGPGCSKPWYQIEPRGFVCANGKLSTADPQDPALPVLREYAARTERTYPYRYGESLGLVRYRELPSEEIQRRNESDLALHLAYVARARSGEPIRRLRGVDLGLPSSEPPPFPALARSLREPRADLHPGSTVAYTTEVRLGERGFYLSADYGWIPKDRVRPYVEDKFRGVRLGVDADLPLAFFRRDGGARHARTADGAFVPRSETFARLSYVELSNEVFESGGERYRRTRDGSDFVRERDAVIPVPPPGGRPPRLPGTTWIDVSIDGGYLLAFEGDTPVYATLISAGRGGTPFGGKPPLETASTPLGSFTITLKMATATMEGPTELVHSDVPWVQNFTGPYSLHTAYWHDDWGNPASAGCVNLSPEDARWLFDWSEPKLPPGWHAIRREPGGNGTQVILHP